MPSLNDLVLQIKDLSFRTHNGAAEENVELTVACVIRKFELRMGQAVRTLDIPTLVTAINERHVLMLAKKAVDLAANVVRAYNYMTALDPLAVSRDRYKGYPAEQWTTGFGTAAWEIGSTLSVGPSKAQET